MPKHISIENNFKYPKVSIIIPVYNGEAYIAGCLESLFNQCYPADRYEIIIIDNNSTDNAASISKS